VRLVIGSYEFGSQKAAGQFVSALLNRYRPGDRVGKEDSVFLLALLERHPEYRQKRGVGYDHFEVMMGEHGTQCFRIVRLDGSGTHFSYVSCIRGKPNPKKSQVLSALRFSIRDEISSCRIRLFDKYADAAGRVPCAITGEPLLRHEGHMDHRPPLTFEVLVATFLGALGMTYDDVLLTSPSDDQRDECSDTEFIRRFIEYHNRTATLDFVSAKINLSQASRNRIKKVRL
jgi:hypothetical protein